ncbi:glutamate--tRNA ligase [Iodidimonas sp. SYSU 1G8]|uniref:glutamate--tRNA ligase n=1 Tax=Iodidimonas sp. SYSU 1G8 TaxID=3133967 RepID=UPI0031FE64E1
MSVRLRFAPSPTGHLHVGNVRTALVNFLFTRQQGGIFMLRMDDTDAERSTGAFADAIEEDLRWLGLKWDTSAHQSHRTEAYDAAVARLKASGRLYPCYETAQELELRRKVLLSRGLPPVYERTALALTAEDKARLEAEGRRPHWRFLLNREPVTWQDGVRGAVTFDTATLSDPVLVREDGTLLYTLPSCVDDIDFHITHVFRGEDHVTNTAAQIEIFRALGGTPPQFAHFALLTGAGGEGLSKRAGSLAIRDLRARGIEPMAINSLLARIGTSEPVEPFADLAPLVYSFDMATFGRSAARFDPNDLELLNARIVHQLHYSAVADRLPGVTEALWDAVRANLGKVSDALEWLRIVEGPISPVVEDADYLRQAAELLPPLPWDASSWGEWTAAIKQATGRKGRDLFHPLRLALTGKEQGPEMKLLLPQIGPRQVRERLTSS